MASGGTTSRIEEIISALQLQPLPFEGGWYRETYRSHTRFGDQSLATAIYYLITQSSFSKMHQLPSDEVFHFYLGDPVRQLHLAPDGSARIVTLGANLRNGEVPQILVPKDTWQGSRLAPGGQFALLGTTMSPGFEFNQLIMGNRAQLLAAYPSASEEIIALTT